jgi:hypothetical protein
MYFGIGMRQATIAVIVSLAVVSCGGGVRREPTPAPAGVVARSEAPASSLPFDQYPGERLLTRRPNPPRLRARSARGYETVLLQESAKGPNFNGHYRVASWGCGPDCLKWAVVDLESGSVWLVSDPAFPCWGADASAAPPWVEIRVDSSLLVLNECRGTTAGDHTKDVRRLYVWRDRSMRHLRDEPLRF